MKKIILLITVLIGAIVLTGCSDVNSTFEHKEYQVLASDVTSINIDVRDREIIFKESDEKDIEISYYESPKEFYEIVTNNEGELSVIAKTDKSWTDFIGVKPKKELRTIIVTSNSLTLENLTIINTNGSINLTSISVSNNIDLATTEGNINFTQFELATNIKLKNKNGSISGSIKDSFENFKITTKIKNGDSNLPKEKDTGSKSLDLNVNKGNVDIKFV